MVQNSKIEIELAVKDLATNEILQFARTIERQGPKVEKATRKASKGIDDTSKAAKSLDRQAKKLDKSLGKSSKELRQVGKEGGKAARRFREFGSEIGGVGRLLRASPYAAAGLAFAVAAREGAEFSRAFGEVSTIAEGSAAELATLRDEVIALSIELGKSPVEVSRALYQAISSGATDSADALQLLEQALKLSTAGLASPEASINGLTNVINAYGLEIDKAGAVSDAFFTTVRLGKTRVEELAGSIGSVAPLASQLGLSYEELLASLAALTQQGLSTSEAFTQIRSVLVGLLKNGDDVDKALQSVGSSFKDGELRSRSFASVLNDVRAAVGDSESALTELFGRAEAVGGVLGLTGDNAERFAAILDGITDSAGATDKAFDTVVSGSGARLAKAFQNLKTETAAFGVELLDATFKLKDLLDGTGADQVAAQLRERNALVLQILAGETAVSEQINSTGRPSTALVAATRQIREEAEKAGQSFGELTKQAVLFNDEVGDVEIGVELADGAAQRAVRALSRGLQTRLERVVFDAGVDLGIPPEKFATFVRDAENKINSVKLNQLQPTLSKEEFDRELQGLAESLDLFGGEIQGIAEDGARSTLTGIETLVQGTDVIVRGIYETIERGLEVPVTFNVDASSAGDFPIPGQDSKDLRLEIPVDYTADAAQFESLGSALRRALDHGLIEFEDGDGPKRLSDALIEASDQVPAGIADGLQRFFDSAQVIEFTNSAGEAKRAAVDFLVETKNGVTTLQPDLKTLADTIASAQTILEKPVSVPIIESTADGIEITERYIVTQAGLEATLSSAQRSGEAYAAVLNGTKQALAETTAATLERITEEARFAALQSRLLEGEEQQIAVVKARSAAEQAAVARRVASGQATVEAGRGEIQILQEILAKELEVFRIRDEGAAGAKPIPRFIPADERGNAAALRSAVGGLVSGIVELGVQSAITARDLETVASLARVEGFELDLATPFEQELDEINRIIEQRLAVVRANLAAGILDPAAADNETAAIQRSADAMRGQAEASEELRQAGIDRELVDIRAAEQYALLETRSTTLRAALDAEIESLRAATREQIANVQARQIAGEISLEQANQQIDGLNRLNAATLQQIETEGKRRQALEGDDVGAGFVQGLNDQLEQLSGGQLGAEAAEGVFGELIGGAEALGASLAGVEGSWNSFRDSAIRNISQIIIKALILKAIQATLGAFGFGGGVGTGAVTDGAGFNAGAGGGGGGFRDSFSFDPEQDSSRFNPAGAMRGFGMDVPKFAKGGIMPGRLLGHVPMGNGGSMIPHRAYASGGIASSPQLAIFGEKPGTAEAFVPLPDGKSIPVSFKGGGAAQQGFAQQGTSVNAQVSLRVDALDPRSAADVIRANMPKIQSELVTALQKGTDRGLALTMKGGGRR